MAFSPSHRPSSTSISSSMLAPPAASTASRQRRMTSPSLPPPSPLNLPEPVTYRNRRPPSPLRNGVTADPVTGEISEDGSFQQSEDGSEEGSHGEPSVANFAANLAQRVGSLVSNLSSRSSTALPTNEELEADSERERDRSRREAERILSLEARDRQLVEERVMAMLENSKSLPPPPSRSQTASVNPPSPSASQKEASWWAIAKSRLTPTKEALTPAQQVIQDTKAREKELEKEKKEIEKEMKKNARVREKQHSTEWPSSPEGKFNDPAFLKLSNPVPSPRRPISTAPSSPTPNFRAPASMPPSLTASPIRTNEPGSSSPSRVPPPLYAQFNPQGTLDVPGTLLVVARRFEKLERWTVGHVRALEDRMDDVERWLVEKEKAKESREKMLDTQITGEPVGVDAALSEVRDELAELQGRIGELGREMAKLVTSPGNLSSGPSRSLAAMGRAPSTSSSIAVRSISNQFHAIPQAVTTPPRQKEPTSPPVTTTPASRTRLPYPTGDYATPPETTLLSQGAFSPTTSPPSSITSATKSRHLSISDLPPHRTNTDFEDNILSGLPRTSSPPPTLSAPSMPAARPASVSPTPRKRYTVALGGPIMSVDRDRERPTTPHARSQSRDATSPNSVLSSQDEDSDGNEETIGKSSGRHYLYDSRSASVSNFHKPSPSPSPHGSPSPAYAPPRARPQSMYSPAFHSIAAPSPIVPLNTRLRSHSTDRFGLGISDATGASLGTPAPAAGATTGKFVDPLVIRRQTKEALASTAPDPPKVMPGKPKVPVGKLVAFFDQEK